MLVTPLSSLVAHRLSQSTTATGEPDYRRSQVRASTHRLLAGRIARSTPAPVPTSSLVHEVAATVRTMRPAPETGIDQCHLDIDSLCRRVHAITASRPMTETRVAFVGDDDLALVALLRSAAPERVLLIDIDERIIATAQGDADRLGYGARLQVEHADLSSDGDVATVCSRYGEGFDVVITDPPYAQDGMTRFVEIAMALTAYTGEVHVAVPALLAEAWTDELLHRVQTILLGSGFVIDQVIPGAFTYETSDVISSLVIARRLPGTATPGPVGRSVDRFYTTRVVPDQVPLLSPTTNPEQA